MGAGLSQHDSSDPRVVAWKFTIVVLPIIGVLGTETMRYAKRDLSIALRRRHVVADFTGQAAREHNGLEVFFLAFSGKQKRGALAAAQGTSQRSLENPALLGRPHQSEGVACIPDRITKNEIEGSVVFRGGCLSDDLQATPARTRKLGGIRVLIDPHFLDGRRRDSHVVYFHSIHDQLRTACADRRWIEKGRHGGENVLIENRHALEQAQIHRSRITVLGGLGRHGNSIGSPDRDL